MIVDIKRAYFNAPAQKDVYIRLPPEDPRSGEEGLCGKLAKSLYGTRDAGANWHLAYSSFLCRLGMSQGAANPCHFMDAKRDIRGIVHGDDFLFTGTAEQLSWLRRQFEGEYECKIETIGYGPHIANSARFLNRVVTFGPNGIEFEPDQRLVEAIIDGLSLKGSCSVTTPGTKPNLCQEANTNRSWRGGWHQRKEGIVLEVI